MRLAKPLLDCRPEKKDYSQINAFSNLMVVEQKGNPHVLQKKTTKKATNKVIREMASWTQLDLTFGTSILAFIKPTGR